MLGISFLELKEAIVNHFSKQRMSYLWKEQPRRGGSPKGEIASSFQSRNGEYLAFCHFSLPATRSKKIR